MKQNISVPLGVCQEGGNISTLENVVGVQVETAPTIPPLTLEQLTELKEKKANNSKTAVSKAYLYSCTYHECFNYQKASNRKEGFWIQNETKLRE